MWLSFYAETLWSNVCKLPPYSSMSVRLMSHCGGAQWLVKLQEDMDKSVRRVVHEPADLLHLFRCCALHPPASTVCMGPRSRGCQSSF